MGWKGQASKRAMEGLPVRSAKDLNQGDGSGNAKEGMNFINTR